MICCGEATRSCVCVYIYVVLTCDHVSSFLSRFVIQPPNTQVYIGVLVLLVTAMLSGVVSPGSSDRVDR